MYDMVRAVFFVVGNINLSASVEVMVFIKSVSLSRLPVKSRAFAGMVPDGCRCPNIR